MIQLPLYVEIAIKNELPPGWNPTGLAERCKIKVHFGKGSRAWWWELPKVHTECVFAQLLDKETTLAYYAWCWGKTRDGSWHARKRKMRIEDAQDETLINVELVNALARCKL